MLEFFREGGWGMWPILIFGMVTIGAAIRFARTPEPAQLGFIAGMWVTTLAAVAHATWLDVGSVFHFLSDSTQAPDDQFMRILMTGLKESTRPGALGGLLLMLASLAVSIGLLRAGRTRAGAPARTP